MPALPMRPVQQIVGFLGWLFAMALAAALGAVASLHAAAFYAAFNQKLCSAKCRVWSCLGCFVSVDGWVGLLGGAKAQTTAYVSRCVYLCFS